MAFPGSLSARFSTIPAPVQGALFMTFAALCFAFMNLLVRELAATLHTLEIAFFRNFFALLCIAPWLFKVGTGGLKTKRLGLHFIRAVIGILSMALWFTAVTLVPLADAVALNFTLPLFATAGAAFFLREKVGLRRWSATAVGFLGMLVILRPGFVEFSPESSLPIIAAVFMAVSVLVVKTLSRSENPNAMVFYMNLLMTPLSFFPALFFWSWPGARELLLLFLLGFLAMIGHLAMTRSYQRADASAVMPFDYTRLPFIAAIAFVFYGEFPDLWTWVGAAIIAGSAIYIARREALVARQRPVTPVAGHQVKGHH